MEEKNFNEPAGGFGGRGGGRRSGGGRGLGRNPKGFGLGPEGNCVCPQCSTEAPHQTGVPCYEQTCPKCGAKMTRKQ